MGSSRRGVNPFAEKAGSRWSTVELSTPLSAEEMDGRLLRFRDQGLLLVGRLDRPSR